MISVPQISLEFELDGEEGLRAWLDELSERQRREDELLEYLDARAECVAAIMAVDIGLAKLDLRNSMCGWRKQTYWRDWLVQVNGARRPTLGLTGERRRGLEREYGRAARGQA